MTGRLKIVRLLVVIILLLAFNCCKKQEAVPGPQGDKGLPGDTGNVVLKETTFAVSTWSLVNNAWESTFKSGVITNNAVTSGEVEVYMRIDEKWWALPYAVGDVFMQASFELQTLHLKYFKIHGGPPVKPDTVAFRMVVFEPVQ